MKPGDEEVLRPVVQPLRRIDLLQPALAHHGDAVAHRHRLDLVVRHVHRRHAELALELRDVGAHLDAQLGVEVRERLVHQEDLRLANDRAAHGDTLALAAGELLRPALEVRRQVEHLRGPGDALVDDLLVRLAQAQAEGDVLGDAQVRIERVVLEDHRDVALLRRHVVDDPAADRDRAAGDVLEPGDHAQRRRLAAAGRADEHEELAVVGFERQLEDGLDAVVVDLVDFFERNVSHVSNPPDVECGAVGGQDAVASASSP